MNFDTNSILLLAVPVLSPIVTAGIKKFGPMIPKWALPMICTGLGTLSVYITDWSVGAQTNPAAAIGLGLAGIGVREVLKHFTPTQDPLPPPPTPGVAPTPPKV